MKILKFALIHLLLLNTQIIYIYIHIYIYVCVCVCVCVCLCVCISFTIRNIASIPVLRSKLLLTFSMIFFWDKLLDVECLGQRI